MPFREIGGLLLLLVAVFLLGMLWFRLVEAVLGWLRKRLTRRRKPPAWHPVPEEEDKEQR